MLKASSMIVWVIFLLMITVFAFANYQPGVGVSSTAGSAEYFQGEWTLASVEAEEGRVYNFMYNIEAGEGDFVIKITGEEGEVIFQKRYQGDNIYGR